MVNPDGSVPAGTGNPAMGVAGALGGLILGPASQLYDSHQNRKAAEENQKRTIAANKAESELAYQRAVQMWHMQNAYNDPSAQMARYKAAGLNPHLIYGQGTPGNANNAPEYNPARQEYNVPAMQYAPAIGGILPTLMAVGSWIQSMKMSEVDIRKKQTETERMEEMIAFMLENNPELIKQAKSKTETMAWGSTLASQQSSRMNMIINELATRYRLDYGDELFKDATGQFGALPPRIEGKKRLEFLQQEAKTRLEQARASWTEFDITNPQQLIMMVMNGILGQITGGISLKKPGGIPNKRYQAGRRSGELPVSVRRMHPARRVQSSRD